MTYSQIKTIFNDFNAKYFNNELTTSIELNHTGRVTRRFGDFSRRSNTIRIFSKMHRNSSEAMWKGTVMHEMVHAILATRKSRGGCGHTPMFHALLGPMMMQEFGVRYTHNRFVQKSLEKVGTVTLNNDPIVDIKLGRVTIDPAKLGMRKVTTGNQYKVVSTGKTGTFIKESTVYGKKHITLLIDGLMFPFTTALDNVVAV